MYSALRTKPSRPEDEYFLLKDAELLARAREAHRVYSSGSLRPQFDAEHRALADAIGTEDPAILEPLYQAGLRADTIGLLESLPALEVAWIDDLDMEEREELRRQFVEHHASDPRCMTLLAEWLFVQPPPELVVAGRRALAARLRKLAPDARDLAIDRIIGRCEAVGRASGGLMGLGAVSSRERRHINLILRDLDLSH